MSVFEFLSLVTDINFDMIWNIEHISTPPWSIKNASISTSERKATGFNDADFIFFLYINELLFMIHTSSILNVFSTVALSDL